MAGQILGNGNGCLGTEVYNAVIYINEARKEKEATVVSWKKMKLRELISPVKMIKDKMKGRNHKITINKLCLLVTYKKTKGYAVVPTGKAALLAL